MSILHLTTVPTVCLAIAQLITFLAVCAGSIDTLRAWYAGVLGADGQREELASSFAAVWSKHANSARLALPLLRTANILYDDCGMHKLPESHPFPGEAVAASDGYTVSVSISGLSYGL